MARKRRTYVRGYYRRNPVTAANPRRRKSHRRARARR